MTKFGPIPHSALEALRSVLHQAESASYAWTLTADPEGILLKELRNLIKQPTALLELQEMWEMVSDPAFNHGLAYVFAFRSQDDVDIDRLTRNLRLLISSASVAACIYTALRTGQVNCDTLASAVGRIRPTVNIDFSSFTTGSKIPGLGVVLDGLFGDPRLAEYDLARLWVLHWLSLDGDHILRCAHFPVTIYNQVTGHGCVEFLELSLTDARFLPGLFENQETSLTAFGPKVLQSLERAWHSCGRGSFIWRLSARNYTILDGESVSGPAAAGMRTLLHGLPTYADTCVLGKVAENLETLDPVNFVNEKLRAVFRSGLTRAILPHDNSSNVLPLSIGQVQSASTVNEVVTLLTSLRDKSMMKKGQRVFGRYTVVEHLDENPSMSISTAHDEESLYLVKLWPYRNPNDSLLIRALWDNELRNLYRISSSPGAEASILTMKDAGIEDSLPAFGVVLRGEGFQRYATMEAALKERGLHNWLLKKTLEENVGRYRVWAGLYRIAVGINLLHSQDVMHRNVGAATVYFDPAVGTESFRLGGFEWSLRLGSLPVAGSVNNWSIPPENAIPGGVRYTFDSDWYGLGTLAARCFFNVESLAAFSPSDLNRRLAEELEGNSARISDLERSLLQRLVAREPESRLTFGVEILRHLEEILYALRTDDTRIDDPSPLVLVIPKSVLWLADLCHDQGFVPDHDEPLDEYNPYNPRHAASLKEFMRVSLRDSRLFAVPVSAGEMYLLVTNNGLTLQITKFKHMSDADPGDGNWDFAMAHSDSYLGAVKGLDQERSLDNQKFNVLFPNEVSEQYSHKSWEQFLPSIADKSNVRSRLKDFHDFLRCTNQLELLMISAQIFPVQIVDRQVSDDGAFDLLTISETEGRKRPAFTLIEGGLPEYLQRQMETPGPNSRRVLLTEVESLRLKKAKPEDPWEIAGSPGRGDLTIQLKRRRGQGSPPFDGNGFIRSFELYGQFQLLERRKRSIDGLEKHSYLLRSLVQPSAVGIDTGEARLPFVPPENEIDDSKKAVLKDIMRVRPIYALQGPPGTGKTTLVSYLLREILTQDPVAQILVTAQAHGAVDVLREKVSHAFRETEAPLAIRLGQRAEGNEEVEGSVKEVAKDLLKRMRDRLDQIRVRSPLQNEWLAMIPGLIAQAETGGGDGTLSDFEQLVQLGASITYCTTSSADLEELASGHSTFDWCVVEEAGKAHGFDLALPMQTAHRWLLLGDFNQLPPYRFNDFKQGLTNLDTVVDALEDFPNRDRSLIDYDWIDSWKDRKSSGTDADFVKYAQRWLDTFKTIQNNLRKLPPADEDPGEELKFRGMTAGYSKGAWSGQLTSQYRMHPDIGDLISNTFYEGSVANKTAENGVPIATVRHPFSRPSIIQNRSIVWLDTRFAGVDESFVESGPYTTGRPRYENPVEAALIQAFLTNLASTTPDAPLEVAILSPYKRQVALINRIMSGFVLPPGLAFRASITGRQSSSGPRAAHTVDSFQGNQADVVIVSLVRNNPRKELGFIDERERLNVLLSRAERLLVLAGSWDFFEASVEFVSEEDPRAEWKKIVQFLTQAFADGRAVRIPFGDFEEEVRTRIGGLS